MKNTVHKKRKSILLLTAAFPGPSEPSRAVSLANMAKRLSRNFDVTVLAPRVYPADTLREMTSGYEVNRFSYHTEGRILKHYTHLPVMRLVSYFASGLWEALRLVRRKNIRLVYAHWVLPAGLTGAAVSWFLKVPLVAHAHGSDINVYSRKNFFFRFLARFVLKRSSRILAVGRDLLRTLENEFGVPRHKLAFVPPVIDGASFHPGSKQKARAKLGIKRDAFVLLYVGDITSAKGADSLCSVASGIIESFPCTRFIFLGDGPLRPALRDAVGSRNKISLPGAVPNEIVADHMRAADLLVLPSMTEGRPVSILEAMHIGLPVVAARVGDVPEMIDDGKNGFLVEPGDVTGLKAKLREIIENPSSLERIRKTTLPPEENSAAIDSILESAMIVTDYDAFWRSARSSHFKRRALERSRLAITLVPSGTSSVLDVGCGRGELQFLLKQSGVKSQGFDISESAVVKLKRKDYKVRRLDIEKDSIDSKHETIICLEVLEHLHDPGQALRKLVKSLKSGGSLVVSLPNERNLYHWLKNLFAPNPAHLHRFNHGKSLSLFRSIGLEARARIPVPLIPDIPGLGFLRRALCRIWPGLFAISNMYLLSVNNAGIDARDARG